MSVIRKFSFAATLFSQQIGDPLFVYLLSFPKDRLLLSLPVVEFIKVFKFGNISGL